MLEIVVSGPISGSSLIQNKNENYSNSTCTQG